MLRSIIRSYTTALLLSFRSKVDIRKNISSRVYEQTYAVPQTEDRYKIKVSETEFVVHYKFLFIKINRKIYQADLTYSSAGKEDVQFTAHYPALPLLGAFDPLYPMSIVASLHLDAFLEMEKTQ